MKYVSTRGGLAPLGFREAVMMGLARDGGLLLPDSIPDVSGELGAWRRLGYTELAFRVMRLFCDLPEAALRRLIVRSYATFRDPQVTPVSAVGGLHVLELFHGPTLAFKDVALQFLGNLFEYLLEESGQRLNIIGATSGDTGSAAISGVRGKARIRIFIMHPHGRTSAIQERQMTSVLDDNVFNLAIQGTFDDCQAILKDIFNDLEFKDRHALGSVNSINWARVLAQIVYYFYAAFRVMERTGAERVRFAVPTGNFGDIFAGYLAARMGLPVGRLVLATNENDILSRFFNTGEYRVRTVQATVSPSMDIQVASNFERFLYYAVGGDTARLVSLMRAFAATGRIQLDLGERSGHSDLFSAGVGDTPSTFAAIRHYHERYGYLLDPHSAVGVHVGGLNLDPEEPMICLATAHPAKFPEAIREATGRDLAHHPLIDALTDLPTRCEVLPGDAGRVKTYVEERV